MENNILGPFNTIRIGNPSFTIMTNASAISWGVAFKKYFTGGQFGITEALMHINLLEFKAILFGRSSLCNGICNSRIKILQQSIALTIWEAVGLLTVTKLQN